jgi:hypothetical protein
MSSAFLKITKAFVAALSLDPPVASMVFKARERQIDGDTQTAVNVQFDGSEPNAGAIFGAPVDWRSRISVDCYARSTALKGDEAIDPVMKAVYARLAQDTTLGGLVADIGAPLLDPSYDEQGQKTGWVRLIYLVNHRTSNLTLE